MPINYKDNYGGVSNVGKMYYKDNGGGVSEIKKAYYKDVNGTITEVYGSSEFKLVYLDNSSMIHFYNIETLKLEKSLNVMSIINAPVSNLSDINPQGQMIINYNTHQYGDRAIITTDGELLRAEPETQNRIVFPTMFSGDGNSFFYSGNGFVKLHNYSSSVIFNTVIQDVGIFCSDKSGGCWGGYYRLGNPSVYNRTLHCNANGAIDINIPHSGLRSRGVEVAKDNIHLLQSFGDLTVGGWGSTGLSFFLNNGTPIVNTGVSYAGALYTDIHGNFYHMTGIMRFSDPDSGAITALKVYISKYNSQGQLLFTRIEPDVSYSYKSALHHVLPDGTYINISASDIVQRKDLEGNILAQSSTMHDPVSSGNNVKIFPGIIGTFPNEY